MKNYSDKKRVRFDEKPTVHLLLTWDFAYRCARRGQWEKLARDQERFKFRIQRISEIITPILMKKYKEFCMGK